MTIEKSIKEEDMVKKLAFFDTKPYDRVWFDRFNTNYEITYIENKLNRNTAKFAKGHDAVCAFVNDEISKDVIDALYQEGIRVITLRSAGYNNVDVKYAYEKIHVVRVPEYSPYAVAEHAMALLLTLNRKIHKAYIRTRDFNFSLNNLMGIDLHNKTIGVIGTGKIGITFIDICKGFKMNILAYDPYPRPNSDIHYVTLPELFQQSDIISLHCPLTDETKHIINKDSLAMMKDGVYLINTSRGALVDSDALLAALNSGKVRGAGLDVYEEESDLFFEDLSGTIVKDDVLSLLVSRPNVIITSHQAFFTEEALEAIAKVTLGNLDDYFANRFMSNEICYRCEKVKDKQKCLRERNSRCF
jgi:D-lactate dehydrogenase